LQEHLQVTAERIEQELGEEREPNLFQYPENDGDQPLPDGAMTVHKEGCFEVIAGRSVVGKRYIPVQRSRQLHTLTMECVAKYALS
jgi:hypothetical protein